MEIAIYSIFNVARVVAAAPNYTTCQPELSYVERERERDREGGRGRSANAIKLALGQINCSPTEMASDVKGEKRLNLAGFFFTFFHCSAAAIKHTYNTGNGSGHESATHTHTQDHTHLHTRQATNQHVAIKS